MKKLVICREDLPPNPKARAQGYPHSRCWEPFELFEEASRMGKDSELWREARRIWWECYWRAMGRYKGRHPFFFTYMCDTDRKVCWREFVDPRIVMGSINIAGHETGVVPRVYARLYEELFGKPYVE